MFIIVLYDNYGEIMRLVISTYFRSEERREINGLIMNLELI